MDYNVRSVSLFQIETTDQTFRITTNNNWAELMPSIESVGLLQPPLLVPKGPKYIVIYGFRRIAACQSIAMTSIPACVDSDHPPGIQHVRMAIADNAFQRPLNVVEQSRGLALIRRFAQRPADWPFIAESVGLPSSPAAIDHLMQIADMPESLQMAISSGSIALPVAISINKLKPDDGLAVSNLFAELNTGLNNQRELFELLVELSILQEMTIARLLEKKTIAAILSDNDAPMPQRVQHLRQTLKKMRYPELSKAETDFKQALKALHLNSAIQLTPPRFFEGKTFHLGLSVNSGQQLESLLPDLEKIANSNHILPK